MNMSCKSLNESSSWLKSVAAVIQHVRENGQLLHFSVSPGSAKALVKGRWKIRHLWIPCFLVNVSAKNYQHPFVYV